MSYVSGQVPGTASLLLHWDLPPVSKKDFSARFLFLRSALQGWDRDRGGKAQLLLGPTDRHALPYIRSLLARAGTQLSGPAPVQLELCTNLLQGVTNCPAYCPGRHALDPTLDLAPPSDRPHNLEPELEFRVLAVESPVCYWVRLADPAWPACWARLTVRLARHSTTRPAPVPAAKLQDGWSDLVAVWSATGHLHRAKVMTRAGQEEEGWKRVKLENNKGEDLFPVPNSDSGSRYVCSLWIVLLIAANLSQHSQRTSPSSSSRGRFGRVVARLLRNNWAGGKDAGDV